MLNQVNLLSVKDLLAILGLVVSVVALLKGLFEYVRQGTQRRAEYFMKMRNRFVDDEDCKFIQQLLNVNDAEGIKKIPQKLKWKYLGLLEDVVIMVNSKIINKKIAFYMFGYYIIVCFDSDEFWLDMNRKDPLWSLFVGFAEEMKEIAQSYGVKIHEEVEYDDKKMKNHLFKNVRL